MKAQILKIAGVKSEKEFYKKYPSEEAFMKVHSKEFKKAQTGAAVISAKNGAYTPISYQSIYDKYSLNLTGATDAMRAEQAANAVAIQEQSQEKEEKGSGGGLMGIMGMMGGMMSGGSGKEGITIKKAQNGLNWYNNNAIGGSTNYGTGFNPGNTSLPSGGINASNTQIFGNQMMQGKDPFAMNNVGNQWANNNPLPQGVTDTNVPSNIGYTPPGPSEPNAMQKTGKSLKKAGPIGDIIGGIGDLEEEKKQKKIAQQAEKVSKISLQAAQSTDVDTRRQQQDYFGRQRDALMRPINGEELFPVNGVGTNVLARNGMRLQGGGMIGGNPTEIQNTYGDGNSIYDDLGYEPLTDYNQQKSFRHGGYIPRMQGGGQTGFQNWQNSMSGGGSGFSGAGASGGTPWGAIGSQATGTGQAMMGGQNAGGKIGGSAGKAIGSIWGPAGGAIGEFVGGIAGNALDTNQKKIKKAQKATTRNIEGIANVNMAKGIQAQNQSYMEDGGYVNPEYNPQVITMFGDHDAEDFADYARKFRAGGHLQSYTPPSERAMETYEDGGDIQSYALGGELQTHWGGGAETLSQNPYLPSGGETIMFRGKSHEERSPNGETGIGVTYGDSPVEVERGEPAIKLKDGTSGEENLTVYGNLQIPDQYVDVLGDSKAKGKKFKNYIAEISKQENNQNKIINKSSKELDSLDVKNSFDRLKLTSLQANLQGANMKLKDIADKKEKAAYLQNAINDTAEEQGLVADDLARGKYKIDKEAMFGQAKWGTSIPQAQKGETVSKDKIKEYIKKGYKQDPKNPNRYYKPGTSKEVITKIPGSAAVIQKGTPGKQHIAVENDWWRSRTPAQQAAHNAAWAKKKQTPEYKGTPDKVIKEAVPDSEEKKLETTPGDEVYTEDVDTEPIPYKRNVLMDIYNQALPYIRRMPNEQLDPRQLYGEMYGLSSNQLEPVDARFYRPQLDVPYDISLQDQRNEVTAQTRAAQRMAGYNPSAQAQIASQAYEPLNRITGEEFRLNQAKKDQVYSGNRATLNDAQLKNLGIADQQYERQAQAKSNTKAITQAALQSIGDKYVQNSLENRKERIQSNLYPQYSFDSQGRVINTGPLTQFNIPTVGSTKKGTQQQYPVKDASGNLLYYQLGEYDPSVNGGVGTPPINSKGKNGKSINARNGSIVKSYKNI